MDHQRDGPYLMPVLQQIGLMAGGATAPSFSDLYSKSLTGTASWANRTVVNITPIQILGFTKFRVTVVNSTDTSATITSMYLGQLSGTYSFAATPTQVLFGASGSLTFNTSGQEVVSDQLSFTPSGSAPLCIAFHLASNNSIARALNGNGTGWAAWNKSGSDDSSTTSKSGYSVGGTERTVLISKVEAAA
jgi:hypothetical protein